MSPSRTHPPARRIFSAAAALENITCVSSVLGGSVRFVGHFLFNAQEVSVEITLRRPLFSLSRRTPRFEWETSGSRLEATAEVTQRSWREQMFRVKFPGAAGANPSLHLRVSIGSAVETWSFSRLNVEDLAPGFQVSDSELRVTPDGSSGFPCVRFHAEAGGLGFDLRTAVGQIDAEALTRLNAAHLNLEAVLVHANEPSRELRQWAQALHVENLACRWSETLGSTRSLSLGKHVLKFRLEGRPIGEMPFEVLPIEAFRAEAAKALGQGITLSSAPVLTATNRRGEQVEGLEIADDFRSLTLSLAFNAAPLAEQLLVSQVDLPVLVSLTPVASAASSPVTFRSRLRVPVIGDFRAAARLPLPERGLPVHGRYLVVLAVGGRRFSAGEFNYVSRADIDRAKTLRVGQSLKVEATGMACTRHGKRIVISTLYPSDSAVCPVLRIAAMGFDPDFIQAKVQGYAELKDMRSGRTLGYPTELTLEDGVQTCRIAFPPAWSPCRLPPGTYDISLKIGDRPVVAFSVTSLSTQEAEAAATREVLTSLTATKPMLRHLEGGTLGDGTQVLQSSDTLRLAFALTARGFSVECPKVKVSLDCFIERLGEEPQPIGKTIAVTVEGEVTRLDNLDIPVNAQTTHRTPGEYSLVVRMQGRELLRVSYEIIALSTLLALISVPAITINDRAATAGDLILLADGAVDFRPAIEVARVPLLPGRQVDVSILLDGRSKSFAAHRRLNLDGKTKTLRIGAISLAQLECKDAGASQRFRLRVEIAGEAKASASFAVKFRAQISNIEGALTEDIDQSHFDGQTYEEILRGLKKGTAVR